MTNTEASEAQRPRARRRAGDAIFQNAATISGALILLVLAAVFLFLLFRGGTAITSPVDASSSADQLRAKAEPANFWGYVLPLVFGTIWASLLAMAIALPIGLGVALFISHFSPRRLRGTLGFIIDMLAAVPSVVFGLWGIMVFAPMAGPFYQWLNEHLGWIPLFSGDVIPSGRNMLTAAIVLAIMILPILTSLSREIFLQTPRLDEEAALALGATRWEMVRLAVFPYARSGIFASAILSLGRALGETMAVTMVLSSTGVISFQLLTSGNPTTIAASIAKNFPEAHGTDSSTLIAGGLVLFAITILVNSIGRWIIARGTKK